MSQLSLFDIYEYIEETRPQPVPAQRQCAGRFLHLGAGVQSSALVEMVVAGELEAVDAVLFADTGDEPPWVYRQVWYLAERLATVGIPLVVNMKSVHGLRADSMADASRFVSMPLYTKDPEAGNIGQMRRQCTKEYKIQPNHDWLLDWLMRHHHARCITTKTGPRRIVNRTVYIESWYGISLDEWDRAGQRGPTWQRAVYPLIERRMHRTDCVRWLRANGLPVPKKSSCIVCPFHDTAYWLDLHLNYPDLFDEACAYDDWLRTPDAQRKLVRNMRQPVYLHPSCVPLREVNFQSSNIVPVAMCGDHCRT
jgi:hypothetical protein